jgi:hypothetical protein
VVNREAYTLSRNLNFSTSRAHVERCRDGMPEREGGGVQIPTQLSEACTRYNYHSLL